MQNLSYNSFCLAKQKLLMAAPELPSNFEIIVIGTGLEESIVAAAAARNGHTVLHIDTNDYYGSQWSAFTLDGLQKWAENEESGSRDQDDVKETPSDLSGFLREGETFVVADRNKSSFSGVKQKWFVPERNEPELKPEAGSELELEKATETSTAGEVDIDKEVQSISVHPEKSTKPKLDQASILSQSKRFSIDLIPHLLFARGSMVELLIKSNISRYTEFKAVTRVLTVLNGVLEHVPSSRSDVFATKHISVIEKRILMKFLNFCVNFESQPSMYSAFADKTFHEFLRNEKLTENLVHFVLHSIAMVDKHTGCLEGLASTQKFLLSLGRFGNTPFLWPMYGSGELPQAFCRLCAVFGGVYYLDRPIEGYVVSSGSVVAIVSKGQRIDCQHMVMNSKLCPDSLKGDHTTAKIRRKICLLSESVMPTDSGEQLSFLSLSPDVTGSGHFAYVQEVSYGGAVCPKGIFCLHMTTPGDSLDQENSSLDKCLEVLVPNKDRMICSTDFNINLDLFTDLKSSSKVVNLFLTSGPVFELDFDSTINRAAKIFEIIFPGEDFLPRAPDPEEIIIGGDDEGSNPQESTSDEAVNPSDSTTDEVAKPSVSTSVEGSNIQDPLPEEESRPQDSTFKEFDPHSVTPLDSANPHNSTFNEEVSATGFKSSEAANSASPITGSAPSQDSQKVEKALSGTSES